MLWQPYQTLSDIQEEDEIVESRQTTNGASSSKPFRLEAKNLFLTYPQCTMNKEDLLEKIKLKWVDLAFAVVARELHEDGSPHLHCLISLPVRFRTRNASALDELTGQHGNYQSARNVRKVMQYVTKGNEYCSYKVDVDQYLNDKEQKQNSKVLSEYRISDQNNFKWKIHVLRVRTVIRTEIKIYGRLRSQWT